ncbi:MAG TPA: hypothetical protein VMF89_23755, partial [Polyangiales bacterium]|nr:hypothetical protein [Polyangiales bacterium]
MSDQLIQNSGLRISGTQVNVMSSEHFGMAVVTFENLGSRWRRVSNVRISLSPRTLNERVIVPAGLELEAWVDATLTRNYLFMRETALALSTLGFGDWIRRVTRDRRTPEQQSGLPTITALQAQGSPARTYLPDHLLEAPVTVPPALFAKRWIVLNTPPDLGVCIRGIVLDFDVDSGEHEQVWVPFDIEGSAWQAQTCPKEKTS